MIRRATFAAAVFTAALTAGAAGAADLAAERRALETLLTQERTAHVGRDPDLPVSVWADDFTSVDAGRVSRPTREQGRARFRAYFDSVDFLAWDDVVPPVITLSEDGTLATVLIEKVVRLKPRGKAEDPSVPVSESRFAWMEVWKKRDGTWRLSSIVSTRAPAPATPS